MRNWGALFLLGLLLGGCWDDRPIQTRAIVLGIGVDPGSRPGQMKFTFAVPSPAGLTGLPTQTGQPHAIIPICQEAPSLIEAAAKAAAHSSRDIYLGQLQYMVISTRLKPDQVEGLAETISRIPELDLTNFMLAADGPAEKAVTKQGYQEVLPNIFIPTHLSCSSCQQVLLGVRAWEWLKMFLIPGKDAALPMVDITKSGHMDIARLAIYHRGRFLGEFTPAETDGWAFILGKVRKASFDVRSPGGLAVLREVSGDGSLRLTLRGGRPELSVNVSVSGRVNQTPRITLHEPGQDHFDVWSREWADQIRAQVTAAIEQAQRLGADPFGFGKQLWYRDSRAYPRDWDRTFRRLPVQVRVRLRLTGEGVTV